VFCRLVVVFRLSVPVHVIDWKDTSPKWPILCWWGLETPLTHSFILLWHDTACLWWKCHETPVNRPTDQLRGKLKRCVHELSKLQKVDLRKSPLKLWTCKGLKFN